MSRDKYSIKLLREEIAKLYNEGKKLLEIGFILNKDHTTIRHHLIKMGIYKKKTKKKIIRTKYKDEVYSDTFKEKSIHKTLKRIGFEKINEGKNYKDYLKIEEEKKLKK